MHLSCFSTSTCKHYNTVTLQRKLRCTKICGFVHMQCLPSLDKGWHGVQRWLFSLNVTEGTACYGEGGQKASGFSQAALALYVPSVSSYRCNLSSHRQSEIIMNKNFYFFFENRKQVINKKQF